MGRELRYHNVEEVSAHPTVQRTQQSAQKQPIIRVLIIFGGGTHVFAASGGAHNATEDIADLVDDYSR